MPAWHSTWQRMRRVGYDREWMTFAEFDGLLRAMGISISPYHVGRAVAAQPPEKHYGAKRYLPAHLRMVTAYVEARR